MLLGNDISHIFCTYTTILMHHLRIIMPVMGFILPSIASVFYPSDFRLCMGVVSMALGAFFFTFRMVEFGGKPLFAMWVWGIFFCFCANFVLLPTATAQSFGTK